MHFKCHRLTSQRVVEIELHRSVQAIAFEILHHTCKLAGAVWAALGLGIFSKVLEGWAGAVIAKIVVLVFIIVFIQKRPQGLFALKGRFAE